MPQYVFNFYGGRSRSRSPQSRHSTRPTSSVSTPQSSQPQLPPPGSFGPPLGWYGPSAVSYGPPTSWIGPAAAMYPYNTMAHTHPVPPTAYPPQLAIQDGPSTAPMVSSLPVSHGVPQIPEPLNPYNAPTELSSQPVALHRPNVSFADGISTIPSSTINNPAQTTQVATGYYAGPSITRPEYIEFEMKAAFDTKLEYEYDKLGTIKPAPMQPHNWDIPEFQAVHTLQSRKAWVDTYLAKIPYNPPDAVQKVRDDLYKLVVQHNIVYPMDEKVLCNFANALVAVNLSVQHIITDVQTFRAPDGHVTWVLQTQNWVPLGLDNSAMNWIHMSNLQGIQGILACGCIYPCTSDGLQLPSGLLLSAFFGKMELSNQAHSTEQWAGAFVKHGTTSHKNTSGVIFAGTIHGRYYKYSHANTWREQFLTIRAGVVRSNASDKRWAVRSDLARIQVIGLLSQQPMP